MKTILMIFIVTVFGVTSTNVQAQTSVRYITTQDKSAQYFHSCNNITDNDSASAKVSERSLKSFQKTFPGMQDESWYVCKDGGCIAEFKQNFIKTAVAYNSRGNWQYTLRYFNEKNMSHDVWKNVKSIYYHYAVEGALQVTSTRGDFYLVYIQNDECKKIVSVNDNDVEEIESFQN